MKHLKENRNTFPNWMYCKKTEIDLSKSGTGLFPGDFYMNRHVKRVILPDYADTVPANMFKGCINLKEVTLPMDPDIGESAFEGCKSLTDIHISFYVLRQMLSEDVWKISDSMPIHRLSTPKY